jgi:hypothetical protein
MTKVFEKVENGNSALPHRKEKVTLLTKLALRITVLTF